MTAVPGIRVGHWTDPVGLTGCTVILAGAGATAAVDVRGAAPGTRETDLLGPGRTVERVHAVLLTGGSAFGLAAADGVMAFLRERGIGVTTPAGPVPIVPAAVLYDLGFGAPVHPDAAAGRAACEAAAAGVSGPLAQGNVGAGTGATVGKVRGLGGAVKGGLGSAAAHVDGGPTIGAIVAVNAFGDVCDPASGAIVAGTRAARGEWLDSVAALRAAPFPPPAASGVTAVGTNTTIAVVATDAPLDRSAAYRLAQNAHDALARAIRPCHTPFDGDTIFVLSIAPAPPARTDPRALATLSVLVEETLGRAVLAGVRRAEGAGGVPSCGEWLRA